MSYYNYNQMMSNLYSPGANLMNTTVTPTPSPAPSNAYAPPSTTTPSTTPTPNLQPYTPPPANNPYAPPSPPPPPPPVNPALGSNTDPLYIVPQTRAPINIPSSNTGMNDPQVEGDYPVDTFVDPVTGQPTYGALRDAYIAGTYYPGMTEEEARNSLGARGNVYDFDFSDKQALKSLFSNLNRINLKDPRLMGGGSGGGSEALEGNMDPNRFISLNPYLDQNVTSFKYGGVVKKKDSTKVNYSHGGYHNPYGVPQYFLGGLVKNIMGGAANVFQTVLEPVGNLIRPVFDVAGNIVEGVADVFTGGSTPDFNIQDRPLPERDPIKKRQITAQQAPEPIQVKGSVNIRQKDKSPGKLREGDFVGNKPNPYVTENVKDELDYAQEGMRMPEVGMQMANPLTEPEVYNRGGYFTRQANEAIALNQLSSIVANSANRNRMVMAKGGEFKPHMMYDPKTGKGYKANVVEDHNRMNKMGYTHKKPKTVKGKKIKSYTNGGRL